MLSAETNPAVEITNQEIQSYVKMKLITELTLIKERLTLFKKKYNCDFSSFEQSVLHAETEEFEKWDDYMEWKAFEKKYQSVIKRLN